MLQLKYAAHSALLTLQLKAARAQSAALKQDQERVVRNERLRAQAEAIRSFAHEFNNVLATILLRAELALPAAGDERLQQCFETIYDCAVRGAQVVGQLQDFSGAQPRPDQDLLDLGQLVQTIAQERWPEASRANQTTQPLRLQVEVAEDLHVMASAADVGEIVGNLLDNACEAMPEGGVATVRVTREKRQAVIRVSDTGSGMDPDVLTRACEPFFTTKSCEHLGLGLSVIHGIVNRSGGKFTIANGPDRGVVATVGLPLADLRAVRRELRQKRDEEPALLRNLHVLVVDDEPGIRETLALSLESMGHKVSQAVDGRQAMGLIRYHDGFDALVVDLVMPDIDGWEVAFLARKLQPQAAIVLLTAWGEKMSESTEERADAVLAKPLSVKELNVAICRQVRQKRQEFGLSSD
jgi:CheY-like chemotaxis protein